MYNLIAFLYLFVLALSKAELQNVTPYVSSSTLNAEGYIALTRQQHENNLQEYNNQIESFKQTFNASLSAMETQRDMLIASLDQTNKHLDTLESSNELSRTCVRKYRKTIPTVSSIKTSINGCIINAQSQVNNLLYRPLSYKSYLENYYQNVYEEFLKICKAKYNIDYYYLDYTKCVVDTTNAAQEYTIDNQKLFTSEMHTSRCTADSNIETALDCTYSIQYSTITTITKASTLINKCLLGQDDCKHCTVGYSCPYISYMNRADVSYYSTTMPNPFYGQSNVSDCLMLKLY